MSAEFAGELKCFLFAELTERGASHGGTDVRSKLGISTQLFPLPEGDTQRSVLLSGDKV